VEYAGAERARPAPGVIEAIRDAAAVLVCPSNPITSVGPILAVPGVRNALASTAAAAIAVSPIVGRDAVSGPAGRLMAACGLPVSAAGVARAYAPWLDTLVIDGRDEDRLADVRGAGASGVVAPIIMAGPEDEIALARRLIEHLSTRP
jgi:LPPG:FO 2-phospho-L-lactate transferase